MLGERYGWHQVSDEDELLETTLNKAIEGGQTWLNSFRDRSVTEIEIIHGALRFLPMKEADETAKYQPIDYLYNYVCPLFHSKTPRWLTMVHLFFLLDHPHPSSCPRSPVPALPKPPLVRGLWSSSSFLRLLESLLTKTKVTPEEKERQREKLNAFFYFRHPSYAESQPSAQRYLFQSENSHARARLEELKARIKMAELPNAPYR